MGAIAVSERLNEFKMKPSKELPNQNLFFEIADPLKSRPFRLRSRLPAESLPDLKQLAAHSQGMKEVSAPIQFDAVQGKNIDDFLWTQLVRPACVLSRVVRLLEEKGIDGWSTNPVKVYDPDGFIVPDYHGFEVSGPAYKADYDRSNVIEKPPPVPKGKSYQIYRGLYFDESQWDGSDMFWVEGVHVVTERTYRLFRTHKVGNVRFTPLAERETRVRHVQRD